MFHAITPSAAIASGCVQIVKGTVQDLERFVAIVGFHRRLPASQAVRKASVGDRRAARNAG
jgi:hypothetical protein